MWKDLRSWHCFFLTHHFLNKITIASVSIWKDDYRHSILKAEITSCYAKPSACLNLKVVLSFSHFRPQLPQQLPRQVHLKFALKKDLSEIQTTWGFSTGVINLMTNLLSIDLSVLLILYLIFHWMCVIGSI